MKCPNCGAEMVLDPASRKLVCEYCGSVFEPEQGESEAEKAEKERKKREAKVVEPDGGYYEARAYQCQVCGAELMTTDDTAVTFCSYCGSQSILPGRVEKLKKPAFIIPFSQTKEDCEAAYRRTLQKASFVPKDMASGETIQKFRGIYMPYWVYDLETYGNVVATGKEERRQGDYIIKKTYRVSQSGHAEYSKISFDASSAFSDNLSQCIAPYNVDQGEKFNPNYLSGFYCDAADVSADVYKPDAEAIASTHLARNLYAQGSYARYGVTQGAIENAIPMRVKGEKMGLFPVWFLGCRSADGTRVSYAVVNGQTGKVAADLPIDFKRYLKGSLLLALPIFAVLSFLLTMSPMGAAVTSILLSLMGMAVTNSQLNEIYARENSLDDKGKAQNWSDDKPVAQKMPASRKQKYLIKPVIGLILSFAVVILNPASDLLFYAAICVSGAMLLLNIYDLIQGHNLLTTRKLPQMEARGGDEHE